MSQLQSPTQKLKKRKHTGADGAAEPSTKRSKKEKHHSPSKAPHNKASEFRVVKVSLALSIPPVFANNLHAGAEEMLDSMLMRFIPSLQGVVLAHDNLQFLESTATIKADCPFANVRAGFDATVWSPHVGMKLVGKVNLSSPDHVSLLVHRTFNASIPRHHIPIDQWEFEYGPAENDPEYGPGATATSETGDGVVPDQVEGSGVDGDAPEQTEEGGRWVHKLTATRLGGAEGYLEFTVVGLTVANQMLSLIGSIQPDPFSPLHISATAATADSQQHASAKRSTVQHNSDVDMDDEEDDDT